MKIKTFIIGDFATNTYVVFDEKNKQGVVIDPSFYDPRLLDFIRSENLVISNILLTHGHIDHMAGAAAVKKELDAPICLQPADLAIMPVNSRGQPEQFGYSYEFFKPDVELCHGQKLQIGSLDFSVLHTPGHSPGSVCFYLEKEGVLFSGDTIFKNGYGRIDLPGGSEQQIFKSINGVVLKLPEETKVYPGHGETTSIENEKRFFSRIS